MAISETITVINGPFQDKPVCSVDLGSLGFLLPIVPEENLLEWIVQVASVCRLVVLPVTQPSVPSTEGYAKYSDQPRKNWPHSSFTNWLLTEGNVSPKTRHPLRASSHSTFQVVLPFQQITIIANRHQTETRVLSGGVWTQHETIPLRAFSTQCSDTINWVTERTYGP